MLARAKALNVYILDGVMLDQINLVYGANNSISRLSLQELQDDQSRIAAKIRTAINNGSTSVRVCSRDIIINYKSAKNTKLTIGKNVNHDSSILSVVDNTKSHYNRADSILWFRKIDCFKIQENACEDFKNVVIRHSQRINRACHYVNGEDTSKILDSNTFYFYQNKEHLRNGINARIKECNESSFSVRKEKRNDLINYLYNASLVLFLINASYNSSVLEGLSTDKLLYYMAHLIIWSGAMENEYGEVVEFDLEYLKYVFDARVRSFMNKPNEKLVAFGRAFSAKINKCLYPDNYSIEEKREFKLENGIIHGNTGKVKVDVDKILELKNQGLSNRKIADQLGYSRNTVNGIELTLYPNIIPINCASWVIVEGVINKSN